MAYTVYNTTTGAISHVLECPPFLLVANTPEGCSAIIGEFSGENYVIDLETFEAVEKTVTIEEQITLYKNNKATELDEACSQTIVSGFMSNALGVAHNYPSKQQDQANLTASVTASLIPAIPSDWLTPFWCEKDGVWAYRLHTKEQIQEVGMDCKSHIITHLSHNAFLQEQLNAAVTLEEIDSIHWD